MKRWGLFPVLIVLLVFSAGCSVPVVEPEPEEAVAEITTAFSPINEGLKLQVALPGLTYRPGEILRATLSLINTTAWPILLATRSSKLFDLTVEGHDPPARVRWSERKVFTGVITEYQIPPGGSVSRMLSWEVNLSPGEFDLIGLTVGIYLGGVQTLLEPAPQGIRLETSPLTITVE